MADITAAQALALGADALYLSRRPLPVSPTGYYDWQITVDPADDREGHSTVGNIINRVEAFKAKGGFKPDPKHVVCTFFFLPSCATQSLFRRPCWMQSKIQRPWTTEKAQKVNTSCPHVYIP